LNGWIEVATGYGLADGIWHPHSWGVHGRRVIETTSLPRDQYYGIPLSFEDTFEFAASNASLGLYFRMRYDTSAGGGFRDFIDYMRGVGERISRDQAA
jgi:hypothetical protein